jgi:hypothetical protein
LGPTRQTNPSCLSCGLSADAGSAVQTLYRMAPSRDKQLEILGGASTGRHGWELLGGANGAGFTPSPPRSPTSSAPAPTAN